MNRRKIVAAGVLLANLVAGAIYVPTTDGPSPTRDDACVDAITDQPEVHSDATIVRKSDFLPDKYSANVRGFYDVRWPLDAAPHEHQATYVCELTPSGDVLFASTD